MTGTNTNTILYRNDSSIIDLNNTQQIDRNQDFTKRISNDEAPEDPLTDEFSEDLDASEGDAETKINQSNYLRYLSELRKADSELALAKAESAELVQALPGEQTLHMISSPSGHDGFLIEAPQLGMLLKKTVLKD